MAEETYNTNKGMNYSFTPTLMEIEKTISLPMLSRKFQTHSVPVLSFLPDYPNQGLDYQQASTYQNNKENLHTSIPHSSTSRNACKPVDYQCHLPELRLPMHPACEAPQQEATPWLRDDSLLNLPFAVAVPFFDFAFADWREGPVARMHKRSFQSVPIPIMSRAKTMAQVKSAFQME